MSSGSILGVYARGTMLMGSVILVVLLSSFRNVRFVSVSDWPYFWHHLPKKMVVSKQQETAFKSDVITNMSDFTCRQHLLFVKHIRQLVYMV